MSSPSKNVTSRGALVVLEGLDRSGKTTQARLLEERFQKLGKKVKVMRFPDRSTAIGQVIDSYLKSQAELDDHAIHLLFSANRWEAAKSIESLVASGTTVICDRYYHSGIVYSAAKRNPTLGLGWARAPEVGLPRPDIVLFLDLQEEVARERGGWGGELYEKAEMQKRVRELFWGLDMGRVGESLAEMKKDDGRSGSAAPRSGFGGGGGLAGAFRQEEEDLVVVDAGASPEQLADDIWSKVEARLDAVSRGELGLQLRVVG